MEKAKAKEGLEGIREAFGGILRQVLFFYMTAAGILGIAVVLLVGSAPFLFHSAVFAIAVSSLFFLGFSFFIVRNYLQALWLGEAKKKERFFLSFSSNADEEGKAKTIEGLFGISRKLKGSPPQIAYVPASIVQFFFRYLVKKELSDLQESLFKAAEKAAEEWVISTPLNLEAHAAFVEIHKALSEEYRISFREEAAAKEEAKAIEELLILRDLAPHEGWVFAELARLYHKTGLLEEEILLYEAWRKMDPENAELQIALVKLLFQSGKKATGFRLYNDLRKSNASKADELLTTLFETR